MQIIPSYDIISFFQYTIPPCLVGFIHFCIGIYLFIKTKNVWVILAPSIVAILLSTIGLIFPFYSIVIVDYVLTVFINTVSISIISSPLILSLLSLYTFFSCHSSSVQAVTFQPVIQKFFQKKENS